MSFQDLLYHLEHYGCSVDHIEENRYTDSNCINAHICEIEDLDDYSDVTLCHYFFELSVPAPNSHKESLEKYKNFRNHIVKIPLEESNTQ